MSNWNRLMEVLYGTSMQSHIPSNDELFQKATDEVLDLRSKLSRQSTMLAEALRLKNECLLRESTNSARFENVQSAHKIALARIQEQIPFRYLGLLTHEAVKALRENGKLIEGQLKETEEARRQAVTQWQHFDKVCDNLQNENERLRKELGALKPPEPKFRVNQVLVHIGTGNAFYTRHIRWHEPSRQWQYSNRKTTPTAFDWSDEEKLRCLTDEER